MVLEHVSPLKIWQVVDIYVKFCGKDTSQQITATTLAASWLYQFNQVIFRLYKHSRRSFVQRSKVFFRGHGWKLRFVWFASSKGY